MDGSPVDPGLLRSASRLQAHRGPDGEACWNENGVGLAQTRLAIIDPSYPEMGLADSPDGRFRFLYNGEIHNYVELRAELEELGYQFRSKTDTEVVRTAWKAWGTDCFRRFNGMWAIAVWDCQNRELTLCRDRLGIKPLCYSQRRGRVAFASEIKAILCLAPEEAEMDEQEVVNLLRGGAPDGTPRTFFRNVRALSPGTFAVFRRDREPVFSRYWEFEPGAEESPADAEHKLLELLRDSVRLRMRSDAPLGICVSGGLDSSTVARLAAEVTDRPIPCFSLRYDEHPRFDESRYAREVASDPQKFELHWVTPRSEDLIGNMWRIVWHHDSPMVARGRLGLWDIFRTASQHVKTALVGEGADELLGGYARFWLPYCMDRIREGGARTVLSRHFHKEIGNFWNGPISSRTDGILTLVRPFLRKLSWMGMDRFGAIPESLLRSVGEVDPQRFQFAWAQPGVARPYWSQLNNALWTELTVCGLPELLHSGDCLGMAHSLECRPAFLDHRVVEFCASLHYRQKVNDGWTKHILRRATPGLLPESVRWRRDKKGVPTPHVDFFLQPANRRALTELILEGEAVRNGILDRRALEKLLPKIFGRGWKHGVLIYNVWRWATVEMWYQMFLKGALRPPAGAG